MSRFGYLAIIPLLVALVAGVTGFGEPCFQLEGISKICLAPGELVAAKVVMVLAAIAAVAIVVASRRRIRRRPR